MGYIDGWKKIRCGFGIVLLLCMLSPGLWAQIDRTEQTERNQSGSSTLGEGKKAPGVSVWDRLMFGGDLNLWFGNATVIGVSPAVAFDVSLDQKFMIGGGPIYQYTNWVGSPGDSHMFGLRNFAMFTLFDFLLVMGQYEWLNYNYQNDNTRLNSHALFLGGGYVEHFDSGFFYLAFLYNVLPMGQDSPYFYPFDIRTGIFF